MCLQEEFVTQKMPLKILKRSKGNHFMVKIIQLRPETDSVSDLFLV